MYDLLKVQTGLTIKFNKQNTPMYYNCHIHTFTDQDIPDRFLPGYLVKILRTTAGYKSISGILRNLIFWTDNDVLDRYLNFVRTGRLGSQDEIFNYCKPFYPRNTNFVILPMDMAYMGAGKVPRPYEEQLETLYKLSQKSSNIIPFIHVDVRREGIVDLFKKSIEQWNFKGVKLYPPLGVFPYDERFDPIYEYCQNKNIPIISHCSPYNPVHFKGKRKDLLQLLEKSNTPINVKGKSIKELCSLFTNPENFSYVIKKFPRLKICLAHFGSQYYWDKYIHEPETEGNWLKIIRKMCKEYENFYTDISFTMSDMKYFSLLKVLMTDEKLNRKILFGSDFYMDEVQSDERRFSLDLRAYLGKEYFNKIAVENPKRFLNL